MTTFSPVNILLVDDHLQNLEALSAILQKSEYNLITATSGEQALGLLLEQEFAVILLDVMMPGLDGFELARIIKKREKNRNLPIIFVTAIATDINEVYKGYSVGAVDYIQKPLDADVVRAKVAVFVELYLSKEEVKIQSEVIRNSERAESLLRETNARMQAEAAQKRYYDLINWVDHAVLWEYDSISRKFAFVSMRSMEILGYPPERWLQDSSFFISRIYAEDRREFQDMLEAAITNGKDGRCEHRFYKGDGEVIWVHSGVNPRKDTLGNVNLLWGLTLDITGFKRAEENQRFLSEASALLTESLDDTENLKKLSHLIVPSLAELCVIDIVNSDKEISRLVFAIDPELNDLVNASQKGSPLKLKNSPVMQVIQSGEALLAPSMTDSILVASARDEAHLEILKKSKIVSLMIVPMKSHKGILGALSFVSTNPDRKFRPNDQKLAEQLAWHATLALENSRLYQEAKLAIQMRENILGIVSHDLRSPLTAIAINMQLILRGKTDPKEIAEKALVSIKRMDRLIQDLLDVAKIDSSDLSVNKKSQDISRLLTEAIEMLRPIAKSKHVTIKMDLPLEKVVILCDYDRIYQLFSNIVGNAIKYSTEKGIVQIEMKLDQKEVIFRISDSGPGIKNDDITHIFEPYWQAPEGKKREGVGLGLFISKKIVQGHGGRIWVESAETKGSTFCFSLPLNEDETNK
jgi:PAS domain S-box-containing protein